MIPVLAPTLDANPHQYVIQLDVAVYGWVCMNEGERLKDPLHRL